MEQKFKNQKELESAIKSAESVKINGVTCKHRDFVMPENKAKALIDLTYDQVRAYKFVTLTVNPPISLLEIFTEEFTKAVGEIKESDFTIQEPVLSSITLPTSKDGLSITIDLEKDKQYTGRLVANLLMLQKDCENLNEALNGKDDHPTDRSVGQAYKGIAEKIGEILRLTKEQPQDEKLVTATPAFVSPEYINELIKKSEAGQVSDGYHTFDELYEFRKVYNAALFNAWASEGRYDVHKSPYHNDGTRCFGGNWFVVMAMLPTGQISNHYEMKDWDLFQVPSTQTAKYKFDGHTAQDVLKRIKAIL